MDYSAAMAKVLLVDDELTMVQMVAEMLRAEGHEVFPYTNSKDALAIGATAPSYSERLYVTTDDGRTFRVVVL